MTALFLLLIFGIALTELVKGLSANGTPPVLQKFSWQMDLAYFMWSNIVLFRVVFALAILVAFFFIPSEQRASAALISLPFFALWAGIYWVFNRYWVGRFKFLPITQKVFKTAQENQVDPSLMVIGVDINGAQKAYPVPMVFYHHQIPDEVGGQPIFATYCGMCRAGRVYDRIVDGHALELTLVGAISFNAVFRDHVTGTWWRQETGEAAKGKWQGRQLEDIAFEQMSLENWLQKHPKSEVLQYDPVFAKKYGFLSKLLAYEASFPAWYRQETPPLVIGVELNGASHAFDFEELKKAKLVQTEVGGERIVALAGFDDTSAFVYEAEIDGDPVDFQIEGDVIKDTRTGSIWNHLGHCISGDLEGKTLTTVQSYQQFVRAWVTFRPATTFHDFIAS